MNPKLVYHLCLVIAALLVLPIAVNAAGIATVADVVNEGSWQPTPVELPSGGGLP